MGIQYRREVMEAAKTQPLSRPVIVAVPSYLGISVGVLIFVALLGVFLTLATYTKKLEVVGRVDIAGGAVKVSARTEGIVSSLFVKEGEVVKADSRLALVRSGKSSGLGDNEEALVQILHDRQASLQREIAFEKGSSAQGLEVLRRKRVTLATQIESIRREKGIQEERLKISQSALGRYEALMSKNFVSDAQVESRRSAVLEQLSKGSELVRTAAELENERAKNESEVALAPNAMGRRLEGLQRQLAELSEAAVTAETRRQQVVVSPIPGTVATVFTSVGQSVSASQTLFTIIPTGSSKELVLFVKNSEISMLRNGQSVLISIDGLSSERYGFVRGKIQSIDEASITNDEYSAGRASPFQKGERFYVVHVIQSEPSASTTPSVGSLRVGSSLTANILVERRHLYEWLFSPILIWRNRLAS